MSDQSGVRRAIEDHDAFELQGDRFESTTTPFEATVTATGEDPVEFSVTVSMPSIGAAAEGEVGDAVADGWFETLELRLADAYDVARAADGEVAVDRDDATVTATFRYTAGAYQGVADAAAIVDYAEGTYVQGVIPGYDYRDPVAGLLSQARRNAQAAADDPER